MSLPEGYIQVEYIESTGTQWIDTGVGGSNNAYFEIDFLTKNVVGPSSTDFGTILGAFSGSTSTRLNLGTWNSSSATTGGEMCWGRNTYNPYITSNKRIQISLVYVSGQGARFITPNGTVAAATSSYTTGCNIGIFCRNYNGNPDQFSKVQLYSLKLYNGASTVVRDFVPCINPSGEAGLYDTVNGKFYGNSGTGEFLCIKPERDAVEGYENITPIMTGNTTPSGYAVSASSEIDSNRAAWMAFNGYKATSSLSGYWHSSANMPQWIMMQFSEAVQVDMFTLKNCDALEGYELKGLTAFLLQGSNNGSSFDTIGTYTGDGATGETTQYSVNSPGLYKYYRVYVTGAGYVYGSTPYALIDQIQFYKALLKKPENLTASSAGGRITLTWDGSSSASGYRIYKNGVLIGETSETSATILSEPYSLVICSVSSCNDTGESDAVSIRVYTSGGRDVLDDLITDRTLADVTGRTKKGVYNASDVNRVSDAAQRVKMLLAPLGYSTADVPDYRWSANEIPTAEEMAAYYRSAAGQDVLNYAAAKEKLPGAVKNLDYAGANAIEMMLRLTGRAAERIPEGYIYSGELYGGDNF